MNATDTTTELAELVTAREVLDYCELSISDELVDGAIRDFAESLGFEAETLAEARDMVEDVADRWRSEFAPSWTIYTAEAERAIYEAGISEVMEIAADLLGGDVEFHNLIGTVADDLTGAVVAAFENADWPEAELCDDCGDELPRDDDELCDECRAEAEHAD